MMQKYGFKLEMRKSYMKLIYVKILKVFVMNTPRQEVPIKPDRNSQKRSLWSVDLSTSSLKMGNFKKKRLTLCLLELFELVLCSESLMFPFLANTVPFSSIVVATGIFSNFQIWQHCALRWFPTIFSRQNTRFNRLSSLITHHFHGKNI